MQVYEAHHLEQYSEGAYPINITNQRPKKSIHLLRHQNYAGVIYDDEHNQIAVSQEFAVLPRGSQDIKPQGQNDPYQKRNSNSRIHQKPTLQARDVFSSLRKSLFQDQNLEDCSQHNPKSQIREVRANPVHYLDSFRESPDMSGKSISQVFRNTVTRKLAQSNILQQKESYPMAKDGNQQNNQARENELRYLMEYLDALEPELKEQIIQELNRVQAGLETDEDLKASQILRHIEKYLQECHPEKITDRVIQSFKVVRNSTSKSSISQASNFGFQSINEYSSSKAKSSRLSFKRSNSRKKTSEPTAQQNSGKIAMFNNISDFDESREVLNQSCEATFEQGVSFSSLETLIHKSANKYGVPSKLKKNLESIFTESFFNLVDSFGELVPFKSRFEETNLKKRKLVQRKQSRKVFRLLLDRFKPSTNISYWYKKIGYKEFFQKSFFNIKNMKSKGNALPLVPEADRRQVKKTSKRREEELTSREIHWLFAKTFFRGVTIVIEETLKISNEVFNFKKSSVETQLSKFIKKLNREIIEPLRDMLFDSHLYRRVIELILDLLIIHKNTILAILTDIFDGRKRKQLEKPNNQQIYFMLGLINESKSNMAFFEAILNSFCSDVNSI